MRDGSDKAVLLKAVGGRVRSRRMARRMTVREFAGRADLSLRFINQLEAGTANISLAGLSRVASALDCSLSELIVESHSHHSPRAEVLESLTECSDADLQALRAWLADRRGAPVDRYVALIGLRGAGKSTIGPLLARKLKTDFVEIDALIEQAAGLSLGEIFMLHGEEYYRRLERQELAKLFARSSGCVLAPGGSMVTDPVSWEIVKQRCFTVWLHATPQEFMRRMKRQGDTRPMKGSPSAMIELKAILARREPLYAEARCIVRTTNKTPHQVLAQIIETVGMKHLLRTPI
jgi:XRE family transcriptional regulator, aerobic/anaerobic benzoate catabolism transcriptional regulator